jgi:predicted RNA-binding protein with PIN domain
MAVAFLIVDGYNLLHAAGLAREKYGPGDLQRLRHRLLVRLASEMTSEERHRCTVVFDALDAPSGLESRLRHGEITVMFAEPGHEADELIEALIASHSSSKQLIVVSSDHRLQKAARHRRADSVDSEVFLDQLTARAKSRRAAQQGSQGSSTTGDAGDVAYWMDEFGEFDVATLEKSDDPDSASAESDPWQKNLDELQRHLNDAANLDDWLNERPERS